MAIKVYLRIINILVNVIIDTITVMNAITDNLRKELEVSIDKKSNIRYILVKTNGVK
jgi:hypothetical protein